MSCHEGARADRNSLQKRELASRVELHSSENSTLLRNIQCMGVEMKKVVAENLSLKNELCRTEKTITGKNSTPRETPNLFKQLSEMSDTIEYHYTHSISEKMTFEFSTGLPS